MHGRTAQPHTEIAHVLFVLRIAEPAVDDAMAARQGDAAIEHDEFAMIAIVEDSDVAPVPRVMKCELASGLREAPLDVVPHLLSTVRVHQHPHLHSCATPFDQGVHQTLAENSFLPKKGLEMNGSRRGPDLLEHHLEEGAVLEHLDRVAQIDGALRQARQAMASVRTAERRSRFRGSGRDAA